jgi:quercetin dioxygenase-like cupin family protein
MNSVQPAKPKQLPADISRYEIFKSIPHRRVISNSATAEEIFDLYQLGLFAASSSTQEIVELVELQPCAEYKPHYHKRSAAIIYIIVGSGVFQLNKDMIEYHAGIRIEIPVGALHGFVTKERTLFLSIQSPPILDAETGQVDLFYGE